MSQIELVQRHPKEFARLRDLLERTDKEHPDQKDVGELFLFLNQNPGLWAYIGDVTEQAAIGLISHVKASAGWQESVKAGFRAISQELAPPDSGPLEHLLAQHVALAWLRLGVVENMYTVVTTGEETYQRLEYWERRLNAAQRRFLRASETLARIRRLNLPALQVNVANQQQIAQVNRA